MAIRVANAPCSWGVIEGRGQGAPYDQMLDELVETGYQGTELGDYGYMPTDAKQLGEELTRRNLTMLGAFEAVELRRPDAVKNMRERIVAIAGLLAGVAHIGDPGWQPFFILSDDNGRDPVRAHHAGRIRPDQGLAEDEWKLFARNATSVAELVAGETGIDTVFHHHCAGFVETPDEIARLLEETDNAALGLVFDTGHYVYGTGTGDTGAAALGGLTRFFERVRYVHFKDCHHELAGRARAEGWDYTEAVRRGIFCELGEGSVDFAAVLTFLTEQGYQGWITVEQDVLPGMGTPRESARRNREYLRSLGV